MVNKEGILFISVIVFFSILYLVQLIAIGQILINGINNKKSIKNESI